jgi:hypothetical protein
MMSYSNSIMLSFLAVSLDLPWPSQVIGVGASVVGDMSSRPNWGLNELDFVFATLIVGSIMNFSLMYLLAPTGATAAAAGQSFLSKALGDTFLKAWGAPGEQKGTTIGLLYSIPTAKFSWGKKFGCTRAGGRLVVNIGGSQDCSGECRVCESYVACLAS